VNPALIEVGPFPPPSLSAEMNQKGDELEQLLSRLGFPDLDVPDLQSLLDNADGNLDWLLARLRTLIQEERQPANIFELYATIGQMSWVRG